MPKVARHKTATSLNRVLLLSDGNANVGLQDVDSIKSQCVQLADNEVTTSTYSLGHQFNERLMIGMADAGLGQGYTVKPRMIWPIPSMRSSNSFSTRWQRAS